MSTGDIKILPLGQVGFKLCLGDEIVYIDPYLSNSVQVKENSELVRLIPPILNPAEIKDAKYILITHEHRDHCDEDTLIPLSRASNEALFIGPEPVLDKLSSFGIDKDRVTCARMESIDLSNEIKVKMIPSAHPKIKACVRGGWCYIGYVIEYKNTRIYHAGDTALCLELIDFINEIGPIDIAMIPVNEINYMREKQGIVGNMSVREAFYLGEQIGVDIFIPTHWDMFAQNQVFKEEIELLYKLINPSFSLEFGEVLI